MMLSRRASVRVEAKKSASKKGTTTSKKAPAKKVGHRERLVACASGRVRAAGCAAVGGAARLDPPPRPAARSPLPGGGVRGHRVVWPQPPHLPG
jgi:hypothetical protein